jgi:DNA-binding XRE family transcriptional regulator
METIIKNNVGKYRVYHNMTQKELAEALKISCALLRKIEVNNHYPKYVVRAKILKFFNVSENQIFYKE